MLYPENPTEEEIERYSARVKAQVDSEDDALAHATKTKPGAHVLVHHPLHKVEMIELQTLGCLRKALTPEQCTEQVMAWRKEYSKRDFAGRFRYLIGFIWDSNTHEVSLKDPHPCPQLPPTVLHTCCTACCSCAQCPLALQFQTDGDNTHACPP